MNIYLVGNDIEIDGEKVARVLDIRSTLKDKLAEALANANLFEQLEEKVDMLKIDLENAIAESKKEFDREFINFARLNAKYNDERFLIKKRINEYYESDVREQKSYDRLYNAD